VGYNKVYTLEFYSSFNDILTAVKELPMGMKQLYVYLLERIFQNDAETPNAQALRRERKETFLKCVIWSLRPLNVNEFEESLRAADAMRQESEPEDYESSRSPQEP